MSQPGTTVFITGHSGYIGGALARCLERSPEFQVIRCRADLLDKIALNSEIETLPDNPVTVLHLATINRAECLQFQAYIDNLAMTQNLTQALETRSKAKVLFFSSTDVFGTRTQNPLDEDTPHDPQDWYALSKSNSEWILRRGAIPTGILRLPGVFGVAPREGSLLRRFLEQHRQGRRLRLTHNGLALRDFIYLPDLLALVQQWIHAPRQGCWNVASGVSWPLKDWVQGIARELATEIAVEFDAERGERDFDLCFNTTRLVQDFGPEVISPPGRSLPDYAAAVGNLFSEKKS